MVVRCLFNIMIDYVIDNDIEVPENFIPEELEEMLIKSRLDVALREVKIIKSRRERCTKIYSYMNDQLLSYICYGHIGPLNEKYLEVYFPNKKIYGGDYKHKIPTIDYQLCGCEEFKFWCILNGGKSIVTKLCNGENLFFTEVDYW